MSKSLVLPEDDTEATKIIVQHLKSEGIFDEFRKECLSDVDTKPSFLNLRQRIEAFSCRILSQQQWNPSLNKNQLRESLRRQLNDSGMVKFGAEHLAEQVINPKVKTTFYPKIDSVVKQLLGIKDEENDIVWPQEDTEENDDLNTSKSNENDDCANESQNEENEMCEENEKPKNIASEEDKGKIEAITGKMSATSFLDTTQETVKMETDEDSHHYSPDDSKECLLNMECSSTSNSSTAVNVQKQEKNKNITEKDYPHVSSFKLKSNDELPAKMLQLKTKFEFAKENVQNKQSGTNLLTTNDDSYLSDVSSVHTSDLSDFDDRISLSSEEEDEAKKVKISLKKVKQMTDVSTARFHKMVSSPMDNDSDSNSKTPKRSVDTNKTKSKINVKADDVRSAQQSEEDNSKTTRKDQSSENTDINPRQRKKIVKQKSDSRSQQRYDASDLYKPRPVIPSRRNRTSALDSGTQH